MKSDLINIFNRLTSSKLADCNLFSELLENHYEKFKYIYSLISNVNLNKIDQIYCTTGKSFLRVVIEPYELSYLDDIINKINKNKNKYTFSNHFKLDIIENETFISIEVRIKDNKKEKDIYESRSF